MSVKQKIMVFLILLGSYAYAQQSSVTGKVSDENGGPLTGVTIYIQGTGSGTITDFNGNYSISVERGQQLVFSFIGYLEQIMPIADASVINVQMELNAKLVDELVVVGYGSQKKESVVGAIATAKADDLKSQGNISNVADALAGSMPGITVLQSTGLPGGGGDDEYAETEILIRGKNTWNSAAPLVLVDGIERDMNDIDINEIESFSVLKDASATAVFGVKGGNGVILVTTKRGNVGKAKLSFEANTTFENVSRIPEMADAVTGIQARNYAIINEVSANPDSWSQFTPDAELDYYRNNTYPYAYPNTDMADKMLKDYGRSHRFNMTARGGTDFVKYFASMSYNHVGDILATEDVGQGYDPEFSYNRFNFRSNLDFSLTKTTTFKVNLSGYWLQCKSNKSIEFEMLRCSKVSTCSQYCI